MSSIYKKKNSPFWMISYYEHGKKVVYNTKTKNKYEAQVIDKSIIAPKELNTRHKHNLFQVKVNLFQGLKDFSESLKIAEVATKAKGEKSINRDVRNVLNFKEYLVEKKINEYAEITEDTIKDYIQVHCIGKLKKKPNTINKELRIVKKFYTWSVKRGFCIDNPTLGLKNPKPAPKAPRFFSEEELQKFFANIKEPYLTMSKLLYLTGLRIGELCNLEVNDYIPHTKQLIIRVKVGNKIKRETIIPLNKSAFGIMERVMKERGGDSTYIFYNSNNNKYDVNKVSDFIKKKLVDNEIMNASVHCFRHTFASHLAIKNVSLYIISKLLRHKSIKETEIYAHLSNESEKNAVEMLSI